MGVLLLLGLLRRRANRKNRDCQDDYDRELQREYRRQCRRQRQWRRRHPHCPAPTAVPVVMAPMAQPASPVMTTTASAMPALARQPVYDPACQKLAATNATV